MSYLDRLVFYVMPCVPVSYAVLDIPLAINIVVGTALNLDCD